MRRAAWSGVAVPAAFIFALLLGGCGQQSAPPASGTGGGLTTPTETLATGTASATTTWVKYTTADGQLTFDLPASWRVTDPAGELAEGGGTFAEVANQTGKVMATLRTNMATGSTCTERYPYAVLEAQDMPTLMQNGTTPRFVFETRGNADAPGPADTPGAAYGIMTGPAPTGESACPIFHVFRWPPNAAMFGAFYDPANNETPGDSSVPYLEKAKKYAETPEYQDVKRMITSLRPVA